MARYWVDQQEVNQVLAPLKADNWSLGIRRLARSTDAQTLIAFAFPPGGAGDSLWYLGSRSLMPWNLQAALSSSCCDFILRQKLSGTTVSSYYIKQLACPTPESFLAAPAWLDVPLSAWILPRVLELTYTSYRIASYARDMGDDGEPFRWIPERREAIRAELDAAMMHVYGLQHDEVEHIFDSFLVLRKYEERDHGEFRTRRLVLEYYDAMAMSAETGNPYRTPIEPPPGEGPRHPARTTEGNAT